MSLLVADLDAAERAHRASHAGATHEEAKPENDKDTRALEQSYVARGQAKRAMELRSEIAQARAMPLDLPADPPRIALGALVTIEEDDECFTVFLAPARGGTRLAGDVQVITPSSPLGRAMLGKREGDPCEVALAQRVRTLSIVRIE